MTDHSKTLQWTGWSESEGQFGLEIQEPWSKLLLQREKSIEVRAYELPASLLNKRIYILQSRSGTAGVSSVGNIVRLKENEDSVQVVGWVVFEGVKRYKCRDHFIEDENQHRVDRNSVYGWAAEDEQKVLFGWLVSEASQCDDCDHSFRLAERRMRSIFQLS